MAPIATSLTVSVFDVEERANMLESWEGGRKNKTKKHQHDGDRPLILLSGRVCIPPQGRESHQRAVEKVEVQGPTRCEGNARAVRGESP